MVNLIRKNIGNLLNILMLKYVPLGHNFNSQTDFLSITNVSLMFVHKRLFEDDPNVHLNVALAWVVNA